MHIHSLWNTWKDVYFMTKTLPKWEDMYSTISYKDTTLYFYNTGKMTIIGNVKYAAIAFAKYMLDSNLFNNNLNYLCLSLKITENKQRTIEWVESGHEFVKPKYWEEFKREFERYCELKAFL